QSQGDQGRAVVVLPNDQILIAGNAVRSIMIDGEPERVNDFGVARLTANGTLDTTFGTDGKVTIDFNSGSDVPNAIALQGTQIVLGGRAGNDFGLTRLNANGSVDTAFGSNGRVTTDFESSGDDINGLVVKNGRILAAGFANHTIADPREHTNFALARYKSDGTLDTSFDTDGKVITDFSGVSYGDGAYAVALSGDNIIAAGFTSTSDVATTQNFAVAKYVASFTFGPVGNTDTYKALEGQTLTVGAASGVLANDVSAGGGSLSITTPQPEIANAPQNGTAVINADGSFTYTPNSGYLGPDSFKYIATDGTSNSAPTTVNITVTRGVSLSDGPTLAEGDTGTIHANFLVTLSSVNLAQNTVINYSVSPGTADGTDYTATTGSVTIFARELYRNISIPINGDTGAEGDETFTVTLTSVTNNNAAFVSGASAVGTILNDDPAVDNRAVYTALGASDAVGLGASEVDNGYVSLLHEWLGTNRTPYNWTLFNRGVTGYTTAQVAATAYLDRAVADSPNLVTVFVGGNDVKNALGAYIAAPAFAPSTESVATTFGASFTQILQRL
ncbi:MAG TPA: Ig-like domain-containing protein, partial [Abditibacteriaceae bacterium]